MKEYPELKVEVNDLDAGESITKLVTEVDSGNVLCDVVQDSDSLGDIAFKNYGEYLDAYFPADICSHINPDMMTYGMESAITMPMGPITTSAVRQHTMTAFSPVARWAGLAFAIAEVAIPLVPTAVISTSGQSDRMASIRLRPSFPPCPSITRICLLILHPSR